MERVLTTPKFGWIMNFSTLQSNVKSKRRKKKISNPTCECHGPYTSCVAMLAPTIMSRVNNTQSPLMQFELKVNSSPRVRKCL